MRHAVLPRYVQMRDRQRGRVIVGRRSGLVAWGGAVAGALAACVDVAQGIFGDSVETVVGGSRR
jgi:hypothetical protein